MGVRILNNEADDLAVIYCSTSDVAFGPVFYEDSGDEGDRSASEKAEEFLDWLPVDPRTLSESELAAKYNEWRDLTDKSEALPL